MDYKLNKEYQAFELVINSLEAKLRDVEALKPQDCNVLKKDIEENFENVIKALLNRRNSLLKEVSDITQRQKLEVSTLKQDLLECLKGCKEIQSTGINMYKVNANFSEKIWRAALSTKFPSLTAEQTAVTVKIDFSHALFDTISTYGSVTTIAPVFNRDALDFSQDILNFQDEKSINSFDHFFKPNDLLPAKNLPYDSDSSLPSLSPPISLTSTESASNNTTSYSAIPQTAFSPIVQINPIEKFTQIDTITPVQLLGRTRSKEDIPTLRGPNSICYNPNDECFYVCELYGLDIRKISLSGNISTLVTRMWINGITVNVKENVMYGTSSNYLIKIAVSGVVDTFVGDHAAGYRDGENARFNQPRGITLDPETGMIFVCDSGNHAIRTVTPAGIVHTLAGKGKQSGCKDGNGNRARFNEPNGLCYDSHTSSLLVCDTKNNRIKRVSLNGDVVSLCELQVPTFVVVTDNGKIIVSAGDLYQLNKQVMGDYSAVLLASEAFTLPSGIAVHEESNSCYVADFHGDQIFKISFK